MTDVANWSTVMDEKIRQAKEDPERYFERARKAARQGAPMTVVVSTSKRKKRRTSS